LGAAPAQFAFDRGQLGGPAGLLALVVSASTRDRAELQSQALAQAQTQLAPFLRGQTLHPVQTVVEKRATFACTPGLKRPSQSIAAGLVVCGDYVAGPYPATLEGAQRKQFHFWRPYESCSKDRGHFRAFDRRPGRR
jgi:hypothetical protein